MKLRQKLAMVLASAMIVTAVPVTTMAASTNSFNKTVSIVADAAITTGEGLQLVVAYTDPLTQEDVFYVEAKDFEFEKAAYDHMEDTDKDPTTPDVLVPGTIKAEGDLHPSIKSVKWTSKTELEVVVNKNVTREATATAVEKAYVPIAGTPKKGTPSISIVASGSFATSGTLVLSGEVTTDKVLVATGATAKNIDVEGDGVLADITIEEKVAGSLVNNNVIEVKLPNSSELEFVAGTVKVEGKRGASDKMTSTTARVSYNNPATTETEDDAKTVYITLPVSKTVRPGSVVIKELSVKPENRKEDVKTGDVTVTVKSDKMDDTKLTLGKVVEEAVTMEVKEVKTLTAGHGTEVVEVTIKETLEGSLAKGLYLTIEGGKFVDIKDETNKDSYNGFKVSKTDKKTNEITELVLNPNDSTEKATKEYKLFLEVSADAANAGDVVITADGKDLEEEIELTVAKAEAPFTVEAETFKLETGVKGQKGGKIVITETKEGKIGKGQFLVKPATDLNAKITDAKVKVTGGDLKFEYEVNKYGEIVIDVTRASDEASEITISDIELTSNKAVADGKYDFLIGGTAVADANKIQADNTKPNYNVDDYKDAIEVTDFIVTGDAANAVQAQVVLTVGNATYTVDGKEVVAETAPFIDPATNRTMAPVRAVAEAFGCELDFFFPADSDQLVIVMTKGTNRVQFQNGSNVMVVNGGQFLMSATAQIKDGYTFVPVAFLAQALNIEYTWLPETQEIVFGNK